MTWSIWRRCWSSPWWMDGRSRTLRSSASHHRRLLLQRRWCNTCGQHVATHGVLSRRPMQLWPHRLCLPAVLLHPQEGEARGPQMTNLRSSCHQELGQSFWRPMSVNSWVAATEFFQLMSCWVLRQFWHAFGGSMRRRRCTLPLDWGSCCKWGPFSPAVRSTLWRRRRRVQAILSSPTTDSSNKKMLLGNRDPSWQCWMGCRPSAGHSSCSTSEMSTQSTPSLTGLWDWQGQGRLKRTSYANSGLLHRGDSLWRWGQASPLLKA